MCVSFRRVSDVFRGAITSIVLSRPPHTVLDSAVVRAAGNDKRRKREEINKSAANRNLSATKREMIVREMRKNGKEEINAA